MAKPTDADATQRIRLSLHDFESDQERPKMAVSLVDRAGRVLHVAAADAEGVVELPKRALAEAQNVRIGAADELGDENAQPHYVSYRRNRFESLAERGLLDISKRDWLRWRPIFTCVDGSVRHCYPFPWLLETLAQKAQPVQQLVLAQDAGLRASLVSAAARIQPSLVPAWRCHLICDGVVEVYRRTCCHYPWVIDDPRLDDLIRQLEEELRWPPKPWPEPDPRFLTQNFFKDGALDQRALNLERDVQSLRTLDRYERTAYLEARPYLWWHTCCGPAAKVAEGFIQDGGNFHICWQDWGRFRAANCNDQYAYKVRQIINGSWVTIYNGVAAGDWFNEDADANLVSYHPSAIACRDRSGGPGCYLEEIGTTGAHLLNTPAQNGELSVTGPATDADDFGLAFPGAPAPGTNRNWGGALGLYFHFGEEMKLAEVDGGADGVIYYRVSIRRAADSGAPTAAPELFFEEGLSWKYDDGAGNLLVEPLGPFSVGGENNLYKIPYDGDRDWVDPHQSFHALIRTDETRFTDGRYLITLEVFNNAGQRLRPGGSAGAGLSTAFTYRRRIAESGMGATIPVNFPALTHLFWWDNRPAVGQICALRVGASASTDECQFLCGTAATEFGINYRAYHPRAKFQAGHSIVVTRGLSGSTVAVLANAPSPDGNVGLAACEPSGNARYDCLLRALPDANPDSPVCAVAYPKCSFTLNLDVWTKTWNGSGHLSNKDQHRQASFALDTTCP